MGHFRVQFSLYFKASLREKSESRTNYHNKNFALRLALKKRLSETRKWSIYINDSVNNSTFTCIVMEYYHAAVLKVKLAT